MARRRRGPLVHPGSRRGFGLPRRGAARVRQPKIRLRAGGGCGMTAPDRAVGAQPWDTEWGAGLASEALAYLARYYPECAASEALREHEEAAHEAAMDVDECEI